MREAFDYEHEHEHEQIGMDNVTDTTINSRDYWEHRFQTDWHARQGGEQTRFFAELLVSLLPEWFTADVRRGRLSLCDWGCAEGEMVAYLGQIFHGQTVAGVDCAPAAIDRARAQYPAHDFSAADWLAADAALPSYDVVVTSNVLEHFHDPIRILREVLARVADKYLVVLVPFAEDPAKMDAEHFFRFLKNNLPLAWDDWVCAAFEVVTTTHRHATHWYGDQALIIYAKAAWLRENRIEPTLSGAAGDSAILDEKYRRLYAGDVERLTSEVEGLRENLAMARQAASEQQIAYEDKLKGLSERYQEALAKCAETLAQYEAAIRAEAIARQKLTELEPLKFEVEGLRENLAMARQSLTELQPLAGEVGGLRENLAMANQALAEQKVAYEEKINDLSNQLRQLAADRDEALAQYVLSRHMVVDTYGRLNKLREDVFQQRQKLIEARRKG